MIRQKRFLDCRTLVISDVHLGTPESRAEEVNEVLEHVRCHKLILNGDIIDGWSLMRKKGGWNPEHTRFLRLVLQKIERRESEVVYLRGNHDDILARFLPLHLHGLSIVEEHIHEGLNGRYLVIHGDVFDAVTHNHRAVAMLGHVGYQWLLGFNRLYNRYRGWRGQEYFSLSQAVKAKVKRVVNSISRFEDRLRRLARSRDCVGIICGHIHTPADKWIGPVRYLNSGDWVESLTALVEHHDGRFEILSYADFKRRLGDDGVGLSVAAPLELTISGEPTWP